MFVIQVAVVIYRKTWDLKCDLTSDRVYSGNFLQKYSRWYVFLTVCMEASKISRNAAHSSWSC